MKYLLQYHNTYLQPYSTAELSEIFPNAIKELYMNGGARIIQKK